MIIFTVMFYVIVFTLCAGAALSVLVFVPTAIYSIPYLLWLGFQLTKGKYKEKQNESVFKTAKSATKLYIAWIMRQKPTF